jgi:hypothetical protein
MPPALQEGKGSLSVGSWPSTLGSGWLYTAHALIFFTVSTPIFIPVFIPIYTACSFKLPHAPLPLLLPLLPVLPAAVLLSLRPAPLLVLAVAVLLLLAVAVPLLAVLPGSLVLAAATYCWEPACVYA